MFAKIFESAPPTYIPAPAVPGPYNGYLVTPPRIYGESISGITAFYCTPDETATSLFSIQAYVTCDITTFPSYQFTRFRFDGASGAYLDRADLAIGSAFDHEIYQSRDGSLWRKDITGPVFEVDPLTFEEIDGTRQDPAKYGTSSLNLPMVERGQDLIVMQSGNENVNQIGVYELTSGAFVRRITLSGQPTELLPEDERRCYVICEGGVLNLVDYAAGRVLSTLKAPPEEAGTDVRYAWDRRLRRLLVFTVRADATDGACLSTAAGYYPVPLGVYLTAPIPLKAARVNRKTPFMAKVIGDAGEGIPGVKITPETGASALVGAPPFTDGDGEAVMTLRPLAAGSDTLDVSATL